MDMKKTIKELFDDFKDSATWNLKTKNTQKSYVSMMNGIHKISGGAELDFNNWESIWTAIKTSSHSTGSMIQMLRVLKVIYKHYCFKYNIEEHYSVDKINKLKFGHVKKKVNVLTKEEEGIIWNTIMSGIDTDMMVLAAGCRLLFWTGLRPSELCALTWENINGQYIEVIGGKHRFATELNRMVRITKESAMALEFLSKLKGDNIMWYRGASMDYKSLERKWERIFIASGLEPKNLYSCRHGLGTAMHKAGYDIASISGQLGHRSIQTTMKYINPTPMEIADRFKGDL